MSSLHSLHLSFFSQPYTLWFLGLNEASTVQILVRIHPFLLRIYGFDKAHKYGQCEVLLLDTAAGGLEREHNIHSRGDWEANVTLELTLGFSGAIGGTRLRSAFVTFYTS